MKTCKQLEVNASATGYVEVRDAAPEPDAPIDDSVNGKLDRLLKIVGEHSSTLAVLRKFVGHYGYGFDDKPFDDGPDRTQEVLNVPGVGQIMSTTTKVPAVGDQGFGFDKETLHPDVEAEVNRSELSVKPDGSGYETRNQKLARLYAKGE